MNTFSHVLKMVGLSALVVALSGCVVRFVDGDTGQVTSTSQVDVKVRFGVTLTPIVSSLQPDRGEGSTYYVGDTIAFSLYAKRSGWMTLVSIDPDGSSNVLASQWVNKGNVYIDGSPYKFSITPPYGFQRVRALFSDQPSKVGLVGHYSSDSWDNRIELYFQRSGGKVYDVAETFFYIR